MGRGYIKTCEVLQKLEKGRAGCIQVCIEAKIKSSEYQAAADTLEAFDNLVEVLTGDRRYFHDKGSAPRESAR